jgi:hypothetical protein
MPSSFITMEQLFTGCCKVDGASPTGQPRVALVDAFQPYFFVLGDEVATLDSGLDEASDSVDNSIPTLEMRRKLKDSTDTTTRRKRELLLDNVDHLTSKLQASNYRESDLTDEVATLEFGLDEASECVDNSITTLEMLRKLKDSTDTTTRRKRELLLDNADRLMSMLMQARNYRESESQSFE